MGAPTPIKFTSIKTEAELVFSLSNKRFRIIQTAATAAQENPEPDDLGFLWHTCDNRDGIIREDWIDHFPLADPEVIGGLVKAIMDDWTTRSKRPANEKFRPMKAVTQKSKLSNGSGLSDSGAQTSAR